MMAPDTRLRCWACGDQIALDDLDRVVCVAVMASVEQPSGARVAMRAWPLGAAPLWPLWVYVHDLHAHAAIEQMHRRVTELTETPCAALAGVQE